MLLFGKSKAKPKYLDVKIINHFSGSKEGLSKDDKKLQEEAAKIVELILIVMLR